MSSRCQTTAAVVTKNDSRKNEYRLSFFPISLGVYCCVPHLFLHLTRAPFVQLTVWCLILSSRGFGFVTMGDEAGFNWVSSSQQHELRGKAVEIKAADGRR